MSMRPIDHIPKQHRSCLRERTIGIFRPNTKWAKLALADGVKHCRVEKFSSVNNVNFTMDIGINFKKIRWNASYHATPIQKLQFFEFLPRPPESL